MPCDIPVNPEILLKIIAGIYAAIGTVLANGYIVHCIRDKDKRPYLTHPSYWAAVIVSAALWPFVFSNTIKKIFKG